MRRIKSKNNKCYFSLLLAVTLLVVVISPTGMEVHAASLKAKAAKNAYATFLSKHKSVSISDQNYYDAAFSKKDKSYVSCFATTDIDKDGIPELITQTNVNFRWYVVRIYTYKNKKVKPYKFSNNKNAVFDNCATAAGGYYFYICKNGHIHNNYSSGWDSEDQIYKISKKKLKYYLGYYCDELSGRSVAYKYNKRISVSEYKKATKNCKEKKTKYYSNNSKNRQKLKKNKI